MASRKTYDTMFSLSAQANSSFGGTFSKAQQQVNAFQKEIEALSRTQSDITAYEKQQNAVDATQKKVEVLRQQYENIKAEMARTGDSSSALANRMLQKEQQLDRANNKLETQTQKLGQMGGALREAGVDTGNLSKASADLTGQLDKLKQEQEKAAEKAQKMGSSASQAASAMHQAFAAAGITAALKKVFDLFSDCIAAAIEYEHVMAGVRRTVGGSTEEVAVLSEGFVELSMNIPLTTSELGKIAEAAGQLGIAREDVSSFTEIMAKLGTTTDLTADNAATMLAQFANITGLDPKDYDRMGAVVADLGDATATTASKVVDMSQGLAAAASIAGMSEIDIMGIAAAVGSLGIEAQAGSTAMATLIQTLYKAVETREDLEDFAEIANMSANEFAVAWGTDAVGAMDAFIQGLNDTERNGRSAVVILDDLGITNVRQTKTILGLANAGDLLSNTIEQGNRAWEENTALQAKADIMYGTTHSQLILLQNSYNKLKMAIAENYTPALQKLHAIAADILKGVTEFVEKNPTLVKALTAFVGVIGAVTVALAAYTVVAKVATVFTTALAAATGVALGPILLVTAAVAGLVAAAVAIREVMKADEARTLSAASREQYYELQALEQEYNELSDAMGETSAEALLLKRELEEQTEAFEQNKMTAKEVAQAHKELMDAYTEMRGAYRETAAGIDKEDKSVTSLMDKLKKLTGAEETTAAAKQQILTIVELLNEKVPELGLAYDEQTDSLNMTADAIRNVAEAELARRQNAAKLEELYESIDMQTKLEESAKSAYAEMKASQKQADEAQKAYDEAFARGANRRELNRFVGALFRANTLLNQNKLAYEEATFAVEDNERAIWKLSGAIAEFNEVTEESSAGVIQMQNTLADTFEEIKILTDEYNNAYGSMKDSVSGQYKLWDKPEKVAATSTSKINKNLESQIKYWQDYNTNIGKLSERTDEIEGLSDMIDSFANGSKESVGAIAGMAKANDKDLKKMVENWQKLQEEHGAVADTFAELVTDFSTKMDELQSEMEATIKALDLSDEAVTAAKRTLEGFVEGAYEELPKIEKAYRHVGETAIRAMKKALEVRSPSRVMWEIGEFAIAGFTGGVESMAPDVETAMRETAQTGASAFAAEEARIVTLAPQLMAALTAKGAERNAAEYGGVHITISPEYHITGTDNPEQITASLYEQNENLRELILDTLREADAEKARRAYR